jgi:hypothetical protein
MRKVLLSMRTIGRWLAAETTFQSGITASCVRAAQGEASMR